MGKQQSLSLDIAEDITIQALGFMARDPEVLARFLTETGMGPAEMRTMVREKSFMAGVLDFFMADEPLLLNLAEHLDMDPEFIVRARLVLARELGEQHFFS